MTQGLASLLAAAGEKAARLAAERISPRDFSSPEAGFPFDIWQAMGQAGLLGLALPAAHGGGGLGYQGLSLAGLEMVHHGGCLGLALSVALHQIVGRFLVDGFGDEEQRRRFLPDLAAGRTIGCMAVSEPGTGAHPKHLATSAVLKGGAYILNGEKTYLTNGPIASLFVVMAVTGQKAEGRKRITAFLVPRDTPGLSLAEPMRLDFLRPAPHGGIRLKDAAVPAENRLGPEGEAYEAMVKPFRDVEDGVMMGPGAGGLLRQLELTAAFIQAQGIEPTDGLREDLGRLKALAETLAVLAGEAARRLDEPAAQEKLASLTLAARQLRQFYQTQYQAFVSKIGLSPPGPLAALTKDLDRTGGIAGNVTRLKLVRLGASLFPGIFMPRPSGVAPAKG